MKKLFTLFAAALVMLAAASCEKNEVLPDNNTNGKVITLKATINNGETKTSLGTGVAVPDSDPVTYTYPVLWSERDAIAVIQGSEVYKFNLVSVDNNGQSGTFELDNTLQYQTEFDASAEVKAFYPYDWVNRYGNQCIIPTEQTYAANSFGNGSSPMAAYRAAGSNGALDFQNLFGALKLQIKGMEGENVQSIKIESENIAGYADFKVTKTNGVVQGFSLTVSAVDGPEDYVTLKCGNDGVSINETTDFIIALHPTANHLKIKINTNRAVYYRTIDRDNIITAGTILKMAELADMAPAYIDETGAYRGDGIALPAGEGKTIIWAPVNCGYEPADGDYKGYPYGKLYQWGRKYGQGYNDGTLADATYPSGENLVTTDPVDVNDGMLEENKDKFYYNWLKTPPQSNLWNRGTEGAPVKTEYDPCPEGWRVPTESEFFMLVENVEYNSMLQVTPDQWDSEKKGMWFYGCTDKTDGNKVFLPAAGRCYREYENIQNYTTVGRGVFGCYWSSSYSQSQGGIVLQEGLGDEHNSANTTYSRYSNGAYVRCIKE